LSSSSEGKNNGFDEVQRKWARYEHGGNWLTWIFHKILAVLR